MTRYFAAGHGVCCYHNSTALEVSEQKPEKGEEKIESWKENLNLKADSEEAETKPETHGKKDKGRKTVLGNM